MRASGRWSGSARADYGGPRVALVNTALVNELYGSRSPVGRLFRDLGQGDAWYEIVGVVPDDVAGPGGVTPHVYFPLPEATLYPLKLLVHVGGDDASAMVPKLAGLVADAEPGLLVDEVIPLAEMRRNEVLSELFGVGVLLFVALVTLLLATSGVYALMSFLVTQRTREIGVRRALGADARLVVGGVFRRALVQLGAGVVLGLTVAALVLRDSLGQDASGDLALAAAGVAAVLLVVGAAGCALPLARALRVQPMRALASE